MSSAGDFYFRDVANELASKGNEARSIFLDEADDFAWSASYFWADGFKSLRRQMFFEDPRPTWFENAGGRKPTAVKPAPKRGVRKATVRKKAAKKHR